MNDILLSRIRSRRVAGKPLVTIVIVNWNGCRDTLDCLGSLDKMTDDGWCALVVDNGSSDDSIAAIESRFPDAVVVGTGMNLGFAGGCNVGMREAVAAGSEWVWLLNNDALVEPSALSILRAVTDRFPLHDFFGNVVTYAEASDRIWYGGGRYRRISGQFVNERTLELCVPQADHLASRLTDWVTGCSMLVRSSTIQRSGMMDESFFLYREEVEWQIRCGAGQPCAVLVDRPIVRHKVGRSTGTTDGLLGVAFMSRNYLKLAGLQAGPWLPLWLLRWFLDYLLRPALRLNFAKIKAALVGASALNMDGAQALARIKAATVAPARVSG